MIVEVEVVSEMPKRIFLAAIFAVTLTGSRGAAQAAPTAEVRLSELERTVQIIRDYNDDFLSVILWSLTTVVGVGAILLGFNWFQSQRSVRHELASIRSELEALVDARVAQAEVPVRERLEEATTQLGRELRGIASQPVEAVSGRVDTLNRRLTYLELEFLEREFHFWMKQEIFANACSQAIKAVSLAHDMAIEWREALALDHLLAAVSRAEQKQSRFDSGLVSEIQACLASLGDAHIVTKSAIQERLVRIQTS